MRIKSSYSIMNIKKYNLTSLYFCMYSTFRKIWHFLDMYNFLSYWRDIFYKWLLQRFPTSYKNSAQCYMSVKLTIAVFVGIEVKSFWFYWCQNEVKVLSSSQKQTQKQHCPKKKKSNKDKVQDKQHHKVEQDVKPSKNKRGRCEKRLHYI